jgi:hypothetical protein
MTASDRGRRSLRIVTAAAKAARVRPGPVSTHLVPGACKDDNGERCPWRSAEVGLPLHSATETMPSSTATDQAKRRALPGPARSVSDHLRIVATCA